MIITLSRGDMTTSYNYVVVVLYLRETIQFEYFVAVLSNKHGLEELLPLCDVTMDSESSHKLCKV